ncbi:cytochrome P450 18a1-like [Oppia nitens]|uniref:cytochrome P450 18a1-like n=1 Tax=Oppia nitens TaxID=1686743 RepID=UPI0023D98A9F|nr:cytochrome P450 18a1-like [Oppia nitens]
MANIWLQSSIATTASIPLYEMQTLVPSLVLTLPTVRLFLIFIIVLLIVRLLIQRPNLLPLPPGPRSIPFLGFLPFLGQEFHLTLTQFSNAFGPMYQIFLGSKRIVVISDSHIIRKAFRLQVFSGRPDTELTRILQGYGIINSSGALWKEQREFLHSVLRKLGAKSFTHGRHSLEHKIRPQIQDFLLDLRSCDSRPCRIRPLLACAVSNVVGSLLMSMTFKNSEDKTFLRLLGLMEEGFKLFTLAMPVDFFSILRFVPKVNYAYQKLIQNRTETSSYFKKIVDEHRQTLDKDCIRDFVDAYLVQQEKYMTSGQHSYFSEEQLIQVMNDMFSAGLENVTSTIEWAVLFLMINPKVQRRVQSEIDEVIGDKRLPELDDLSSMPYTEATFWEVLRRSNVIALGNAHSTLEESTLCGYRIPVGTNILPNLYAINMDPKLWLEPEKFEPERFLRNGKVYKPDYFIPFSVGRRMCLGDVLTKMEFFLFMSSLLQQFDLCVPHNEEPPQALGITAATMAPKPFQVCAIPRKSHQLID